MRAARSSSEREHHRAAFALEELRIGRRALEDRAVRRERAEERDQPALLGKSDRQSGLTTARSTHVGCLLEPLAQRDPGHRHAVEMQQRLQLAQHGADAARGVEVRHVVLARWA